MLSLLSSFIKSGAGFFNGKGNLVNIIICLSWLDMVWPKVITLRSEYCTFKKNREATLQDLNVYSLKICKKKYFYFIFQIYWLKDRVEVQPERDPNYIQAADGHLIIIQVIILLLG
jgi:hypothetical protein